MWAVMVIITCIRHLENQETQTKTGRSPTKEWQSGTFLAAHVSVIYGNFFNGKYRVGGKKDLPVPFIDLI